MKISLATSLHLNHAAMSLDHRPGEPLPMQSFVPVGLLCLKAYADQAIPDANIRVTEINGLINKGPALAPWRPQQTVSEQAASAIANDDGFYEHIVDAILQPDDALVGLMTDADSLHHTLLIAHHIKRRCSQTLVCLGGPASSPIGRHLLETFRWIDLVVVGEGELTFVELIQALQESRPLGGILGLTWRDHDVVVENAARPLIEDLDTLPLSAFDAYDMSSGAPLYLDVGRGCPFKCSFCATSPFWKRMYRMKSIDRIVEEMTLVRDRYGRTQVNFSHDIFTCDRAWTHRFCDRLIADQIGMKWTCSTRTDIIDPELLAKMASAGCESIYYGIESGSDAIQKQINKNLDLNWARTIVRETATLGIQPVTGFIVGYPMENYQSLQATIERFFDFLQVGGFRAHLFTLCPFHESPMYREHHHTINRPAEYYDLPLTPGAAAEGAQLTSEHRDIFSSICRYATPGVPERLIDASEDISAQLVVLKAIWPLLLPYYPSPLDWYIRWVDWIEADNLVRRPGTQMPHQGNAYDVLRFVDQEVVRLDLADSDIADLVRYERMKLDARQRLRPAARNSQRLDGEQIGRDTLIARGCDYLAAPFHHDLRALLAGKRSNGDGTVDDRWIIVAKTAGDEINTIQLSGLAKQILDRADGPQPAGELVASALHRNGATSEAEFLTAIQLMRSLIGYGLLWEVHQ